MMEKTYASDCKDKCEDNCKDTGQIDGPDNGQIEGRTHIDGHEHIKGHHHVEGRNFCQDDGHVSDQVQGGGGRRDTPLDTPLYVAPFL